MKFKVTASRIIGGPRNPFIPKIEDFPTQMKSHVKEWEFEAKDEAEVRKFWDDAQKQKLQEVVGFSLRSIAPIDL